MSIKYSDETYGKLGRLLQRLRDNPKTSKVVAKAITAIDDSYKFPDLEQDQLKEYVDNKFESLQNDREREDFTKRLAFQRRQVMQSFGHEPADQEKHIAGVEKVMQETGLYDYHRAAKLYAAENPPPPPRPESRSANWQAPNAKELFENPLNYERSEAYKAIDDIMVARKQVH